MSDVRAWKIPQPCLPQIPTSWMKHPSACGVECKRRIPVSPTTDTRNGHNTARALHNDVGWELPLTALTDLRATWLVAVGAVARLRVHRRAEHHDGGVADPLELGAGDPRTADVTREKQAVATGRVDRHLTTVHRATTPFHTVEIMFKSLRHYTAAVEG